MPWMKATEDGPGEGMMESVCGCLVQDVMCAVCRCLQGELLVQMYSRVHGLATCSLRFFMVSLGIEIEKPTAWGATKAEIGID